MSNTKYPRVSSFDSIILLLRDFNRDFQISEQVYFIQSKIEPIQITLSALNLKELEAISYQLELASARLSFQSFGYSMVISLLSQTNDSMTYKRYEANGQKLRENIASRMQDKSFMERENNRHEMNSKSLKSKGKTWNEILTASKPMKDGDLK